MGKEDVRIKVVERGQPNLRKLARALLLLVEQQEASEPAEVTKKKAS